MPLAEDVAQHAFCRALEVWKVRGVPENPSAWLLATAKHRALDLLRRERTARSFAPEISRLLDSEGALRDAVDDAFTATAIRDEQLRLMFSCCPPSLPEPARIALILNISCGFGAAEIGAALLSGRAAVEKRIRRGKQALAARRGLFDLSRADFDARLSSVRHALYLLFNEGYHCASQAAAVRPELCVEAMRLTALLGEHAPSATPTTNALLALMCLNAGRLPARVDSAGDLRAWSEQDRSSWDGALVAQGLRAFERATAGDELSAYHVEAAIAVVHASASSHETTDWARIAQLYEQLSVIAPSPVIALARAIALGERDGPTRALAELRAIAHAERLAPYPFYAAALGEFELRLGNRAAAREHFAAALGRARNEAERRFLRKRLAEASH